MRTDILKPASHDIIALGDAVESRFLDLTHLYLRIRGVELPIPKTMDRDFLLWRTMIKRHRAGDFRFTDSEKKAVRAIAEWTLKINCDLRNQDYTPIQWKD